MKLIFIFLFFLLVSHIKTTPNLITDPGFETLGLNLTSTNSTGIETFSYTVITNGQSPWYSTISGGILIRQKMDINTKVMDTLNLNYHQKICQNFVLTSDIPYELSFDYLIDNNVGSAFMIVSFNGEDIFIKMVSQRVSQRVFFKVYLTSHTNILCFEGSNYENPPIGALIDNVTLAPYDIRYIQFIPQPALHKVNHIQLVSNEIVVDSSHLQVFKTQSTLNIPNVKYLLVDTYANSNNNLVFLIEIEGQYASTQAKPIITLPQHRNTDGQIIIYIVNSDSLPKFLYEPEDLAQVTDQSEQYLLLFSKIYNIAFRVIKILGFCFIGIRFLNFYYLFLFLSFLNIEFILPSVRRILNQLATQTINSQTIGFFMKISGQTPFQFGAQYLSIHQIFSNLNQAGLEYSEAGISPHVYSLIADNLLIALLNTLKIFALYYILFKSKKKFLKVLEQIKNQKIILQFVPILSVIVLAAGVCCINAVQFSNFYGKINRGILLFLPIISVFLCFIMFFRQKVILSKLKAHQNSKLKSVLQLKQKAQNQYQIKLNLIQNLMFVIIPWMVGLGFVYSALSVFTLSTLLKFVYSILTLKTKPSLLQFVWTITIFLQIFLLVCFFLPQIISSMDNFSPAHQLNWMSFLRYNSIAFLYIFIVGGFLEILSSVYTFFYGLSTLSLVCPQKSNVIVNFQENTQNVENQQSRVSKSQNKGYHNESMSGGIIESAQQDDKISNPFKTRKVLFKEENATFQIPDNQSSPSNTSIENNILQHKAKNKKSPKVKHAKHVEQKEYTQETFIEQKQNNTSIFNEGVNGRPRQIAKLLYSSGEKRKENVFKKTKEEEVTSFKVIKKLQLMPKISEVSQGPQTHKDIDQKQQNFT